MSTRASAGRRPPSSSSSVARSTRRSESALLLEALTEIDLVPVRIQNGAHALAPLLICRLPGNLDTCRAQSGDLAIDVVRVEPQGRAAGRSDVARLREAERERTEHERDEAREPVSLFEPEALCIEPDHTLEVGRLEDRERVAERRQPSRLRVP